MQHNTGVTCHLTQRVGLTPPVFGCVNAMILIYTVDAVCSFHNQWRETDTSGE